MTYFEIWDGASGNMLFRSSDREEVSFCLRELGDLDFIAILVYIDDQHVGTINGPEWDY